MHACKEVLFLYACMCGTYVKLLARMIYMMKTLKLVDAPGHVWPHKIPI